MRKKVLIAVEQSIHSQHALAYAAGMAGIIRDIDFVLFYVQPVVSGYLTEDALKSPKARAELDAVNQKNRADALELLEKCRRQLAESGVGAGCIETKTVRRQAGVADEILNAAESGDYDALLIGRRGISGFQELFMGSVTANLLPHCKRIPLWLVDGRVSPGKILIAVDGSVNSLRAVDHVAFMLSGSTGASIELLHVQPRLGDFCDINSPPTDADAKNLKEAIMESNRRCITDFKGQAFSMLREAGIAEEQVSVQEVDKRQGPAKAIVEKARKEGFGTVVVGRQGASGGGRFMGKVASAVVHKIKDNAVWVIP